VTAPGLPTRPTTPTDKFLFGSGTKPLTAVAVLRLVELGAISLDDKVEAIVDPILKAKNGTSLRGLFGDKAARVTVGHLLRMQSGIADFDTPELDQAILLDGDGYWPPYGVLRAAASQKPTFHCEPGSCVEYSSTNYVLAGLVLLAHDPSAGMDWRRLSQFDLVFPPSMQKQYAEVSFIMDEVISSVATVPGVSGMISRKKTPIWDQHGGVLGWTCGNVAASAADIARFYYDLLAERTLLKPSTVDTMEQFEMLNVGWAKGRILYGAGLMIEQTSFKPSLSPPSMSQWGAYMGHGGDTYGFLSEQGIVELLGNASIAVVSNQDYNGVFVQHTLLCRVITIAAKVLRGEDISLSCGSKQRQAGRS
jgi:CubicO group peptidase (beta-lactamase class C family)